MLIGEYQTKLTDKNRVAVPAEFRKLLGNKIVITKGYEGCLIITSADMFQRFIEPLKNGPFFSKSIRESTRFLVGSAFNVDLDDQGRFVLPTSLLAYSGIKGIAVFTGLNTWIELWDKKKWDEQMKDIEVNASDIAETLNSTDHIQPN